MVPKAAARGVPMLMNSVMMMLACIGPAWAFAPPSLVTRQQWSTALRPGVCVAPDLQTTSGRVKSCSAAAAAAFPGISRMGRSGPVGLRAQVQGGGGREQEGEGGGVATTATAVLSNGEGQAIKAEEVQPSNYARLVLSAVGNDVLSNFTSELGTYDIDPDMLSEGEISRPIYRQRGGNGVIYYLDGNWVVGSVPGSFENVSFFAQSEAMSPDQVHLDDVFWYQFDGEHWSPITLTAEPETSSAVKMLELAARQNVTITRASERLEDAGGPMAWSQQETGYDAPLTRLRLHLTADALSDSSWGDANKLLKDVLVGLYEATGSARRGYRTDQRLPSAHAQALKCLLEAEASTEGTDVSKLVKFIIKKEGLYPIGQKVMKESLVPVFTTRLPLIKMCQAIERATAGVASLLITYKIIRDADERKDMCASLKPMCEHMHVNDKPAALIVSCYGFFTPGFGRAPSKAFDDTVHAAVRDMRFLKMADAVPKGKSVPGGVQKVKSALVLLEGPARWASVWESRGREAGSGRGGSEPADGSNREKRKGKGKGQGEGQAGSEVGDLLVKIGNEAGGAELIRGLTMMSLEATRRYMLRRGALPLASPDVAGSKNALVVLSAWRSLVEGRKKERVEFGNDVQVVGRMVLSLARMQQRGYDGAAGGETEDEGEVEGHVGVEGAKGGMLVGRELSLIVNIVVSSMWMRGGYGTGATGRVVRYYMAGRSDIDELCDAVKGDIADLLGIGMVDGGLRGAKASRGGGEGAVVVVEEEYEALCRGIERVMREWRQPHLLMLYHSIHRDISARMKSASVSTGATTMGDVCGLHVRLLRAIFGVGQETIDDIRMRDEANRRHLDACDEGAVAVLEGLGGGERLVEEMFMMGHDSGTCMQIKRDNAATNRALLGYMCQGNARLVGVRGEEGRYKVRSVARLLLKRKYEGRKGEEGEGSREREEQEEDGEGDETVLFLDKPYDESGAGVSVGEEEEVLRLGAEIAAQMNVKMYSFRDMLPPPSTYQVEEAGEVGGGGEEDEGGEGDMDAGGGAEVDDGAHNVWELYEKDGVAPYVWREGRSRGYGVQVRGASKGREVVLAWVAGARQASHLGATHPSCSSWEFDARAMIQDP